MPLAKSSIGALEQPHRVKRVLAGRVQQARRRLRVLRFERGGEHLGLVARADPELIQGADGQRGFRALKRSRQLRRERDRAERARLFVFLRMEVPVHPTVAGALVAGRAAFHVVLRVEVGSRFVV